MSLDFLKMIPFLWKWEGTKYENDPSDPGGATRYGIDQRSHPDVDIKNLTENQAKQIYWDCYWLKNGCDKYPQPFSGVLFDTCVNCGRGRADKCNTSKSKDYTIKAKTLLDNRDSFYKRLAEARPASKKYLVGWLNRTRDLRKFLEL